jgi:hypothetical protein
MPDNKHPVTFLMPRDLELWLQRYCMATGLTPNAVIERALTDYWRAQQDKPGALTDADINKLADAGEEMLGD